MALNFNYSEYVGSQISDEVDDRMARIFDQYLTASKDALSEDSTMFKLTKSRIMSDSFRYVPRPDPVEFVDSMPSAEKLADMCNEFPALKATFDEFLLVYKLVEPEYTNNKEDTNK